jgi:hypothetical protein
MYNIINRKTLEPEAGGAPVLSRVSEMGAISEDKVEKRSCLLLPNRL